MRSCPDCYIKDLHCQFFPPEDGDTVAIVHTLAHFMRIDPPVYKEEASTLLRKVQLDPNVTSQAVPFGKWFRPQTVDPMSWLHAGVPLLPAWLVKARRQFCLGSLQLCCLFHIKLHWEDKTLSHETRAMFFTVLASQDRANAGQ